MPKKYFQGGCDVGAESLRLLILPHAGAGAGIVRGLIQCAPCDWLIAGARFPGRESRYDERVPSFGELVHDTVDTVESLPGTAPLLLVGVCTGGVIALEVARQLEGIPGNSPVRGIVTVATEAPRSAFRDDPPEFDDEAIVAAMVASGVIPKQIIDDDELSAVVLPTLLADIRTVESHDVYESPILSVPILVFRDHASSLELYQSWALYAPDVAFAELENAPTALLKDTWRLTEAILENLDLFVGGAKVRHSKRGGLPPA